MGRWHHEPLRQRQSRWSSEDQAALDIDLGQHETVDEVLTVAVGDCAARYLVAVYCTSPLGERAHALHVALEKVEPLSYLGEPIAAMERVATVPLPGLSKCVPQWVTLLEGAQTPAKEWENAQHYRLREAVERSEGVAGLVTLDATRPPIGWLAPVWWSVLFGAFSALPAPSGSVSLSPSVSIPPTAFPTDVFDAR